MECQLDHNLDKPQPITGGVEHFSLAERPSTCAGPLLRNTDNLAEGGHDIDVVDRRLGYRDAIGLVEPRPYGFDPGLPDGCCRIDERQIERLLETTNRTAS